MARTKQTARRDSNRGKPKQPQLPFAAEIKSSSSLSSAPRNEIYSSPQRSLNCMFDYINGKRVISRRVLFRDRVLVMKNGREEYTINYETLLSEATSAGLLHYVTRSKTPSYIPDDILCTKGVTPVLKPGVEINGEPPMELFFFLLEDKKIFFFFKDDFADVLENVPLDASDPLLNMDKIELSVSLDFVVTHFDTYRANLVLLLLKMNEDGKNAFLSKRGDNSSFLRTLITNPMCEIYATASAANSLYCVEVPEVLVEVEAKTA